MAKPTVTLLIVLLLSGCVTGVKVSDEAYFERLAPARPEHALVYISRPGHGYASGTWPDVYFNDTKVVGLKNGGFSYVYASPGRYRVSAKKSRWYFGPWGEEITVTVAPDRAYLLTINVLQQATAGADRAWTLRQVTPSDLAPLRRQDYIEADAQTVSSAY